MTVEIERDPKKRRGKTVLVVEDNAVRWVLSQTKVEKVPTPFQELVEQPKAA